MTLAKIETHKEQTLPLHLSCGPRTNLLELKIWSYKEKQETPWLDWVCEQNSNYFDQVFLDVNKFSFLLSDVNGLMKNTQIS